MNTLAEQVEHFLKDHCVSLEVLPVFVFLQRHKVCRFIPIVYVVKVLTRLGPFLDSRPGSEPLVQDAQRFLRL